MTYNLGKEEDNTYMVGMMSLSRSAIDTQRIWLNACEDMQIIHRLKIKQPTTPTFFPPPELP